MSSTSHTQKMVSNAFLREPRPALKCPGHLQHTHFRCKRIRVSCRQLLRWRGAGGRAVVEVSRDHSRERPPPCFLRGLRFRCCRSNVFFRGESPIERLADAGQSYRLTCFVSKYRVTRSARSNTVGDKREARRLLRYFVEVRHTFAGSLLLGA